MGGGNRPRSLSKISDYSGTDSDEDDGKGTAKRDDKSPSKDGIRQRKGDKGHKRFDDGKEEDKFDYRIGFSAAAIRLQIERELELGTGGAWMGYEEEDEDAESCRSDA